MLVALITGRFSVRAVPLPMFVLVLALLALTAISSIFAILPGRASVSSRSPRTFTVFALWLTGYVNSVERARSVIRPLVAGAVVSSLVGVAVLFVSFPAGRWLTSPKGTRAAGLFKDPNVFGPFLVVVALIVLAEILDPDSSRGRLLTKLGILLSLSLGIVFAYSRAAWLNAAVGVLVMLFVYARRQGGVKVAKIVVALAVASRSSPSLWLQRGRPTSFKSEPSFSPTTWSDSPASGQGSTLPSSTRWESVLASSSRPWALHPTASYVRLLAEQGILAVVVLGALLFGTLGFAAANAARGRDSYGISSAALLAAWCGAVVNSAFVDTLHWRHFWLVAALIWVGAMRHDAMSRPVPWDALRAGAR